MKTITIHGIPGFDEWRDAARESLVAGIAPSNIIWNNTRAPQNDLFADNIKPSATPDTKLTISRTFLEKAQAAICHIDNEKYALLYKILWRLTHENKHLLSIATDDDILRLNEMTKAVHRDAYKITAFLRFREIKHEGEEHFIAWYQPEYYTLERVLPFFQTRFRNMRWTILTPYRAAHWDKEEIRLEDNPDPALFPKDDQVEAYWMKYYASIFNPARTKKSAMLNQMPKKYWKNMPETALIPDMLRTAEARVKKFMD